jgi:hypothetical protein
MASAMDNLMRAVLNLSRALFAEPVPHLISCSMKQCCLVDAALEMPLSIDSLCQDSLPRQFRSTFRLDSD